MSVLLDSGHFAADILQPKIKSWFSQLTASPLVGFVNPGNSRLCACVDSFPSPVRVLRHRFEVHSADWPAMEFLSRVGNGSSFKRLCSLPAREHSNEELVQVFALQKHSSYHRYVLFFAAFTIKKCLLELVAQYVSNEKVDQL